LSARDNFDSKNMEMRLKDIVEEAREAVVTLWHAGEGDRVAKGDDLLEISTDKATFDVPAPCDGVLVRIAKTEGEDVLPDDVIAVIE